MIPRILHSARPILAMALLCALFPSPSRGSDQPRPNVILILTDDQAFGDLSTHGNPKLKTPNIDRIAAEGVELEHFYVSPVCTPTRASLMTGRYNFRTRAIDTFQGRAMMDPREITLAETLRAAGYRTAIFGKWHLGDNYPMRPMDKGFERSVVIRGGGVSQASDPPGSRGYFNPILTSDGKLERFKGHCTDIFTDLAIEFLGRAKLDIADGHPFFLYLPYNAPHTPLEAPEETISPFRAMNLGDDEFPQPGAPMEAKTDPEGIAKLYGMVAQIDANIGRLLAKLDELGLAENTIVVFMSDNGPQNPRFNSGLRGLKGSTWEGGIRVPFFIRWPGKLKAGAKVSQVAAHIDVAPTLLDACGVKADRPPDAPFDGRSVLAALRGEAGPVARDLFFQWHRGNIPQRRRAFAVRSGRFKLSAPELALKDAPAVEPSPFHLYDVEADPYESRDLSAERPELVESLLAKHDAWFDDVTKGVDYETPPRIALGSAKENPSLLSPQDWRTPTELDPAHRVGFWEVEIAEAGAYDFKLMFDPLKSFADVHLRVGDQAFAFSLKAGAVECRMDGVKLEKGPARLKAWIDVEGEERGAKHVEVTRRSAP